MQRDDWLLCVDESGDFDDPRPGRRSAIVVGLLVRATDGADLRRVWRTRIESALAPLPWPPHAADLRQDAWLAAASEVWGGATGRAASLRAAGAPAARFLAESDPGAWSTLCAALRRRERFDFSEVLTLGRKLRASDVGIASLRQWRTDARRRLHAFLDDVVDEAGGDAHLLVCEAGPSEAGQIGVWMRDAYVDALGVLLERAKLLLEAEGVVRPVMSVVATRTVRHHLFGRQPIRGHDLSQLERAVCGGLPGAGAVRFDFPGPPQSYDAQVHPGVVLADLLALRARWEVERARGRSILDLGDRLRARGALGGHQRPLSIGLTPDWSAERALPTLWPSASAAQVSAKLRGRLASVEGSGTRWGDDSDAAWLDAAPRYREVWG